MHMYLPFLSFSFNSTVQMKCEMFASLVFFKAYQGKNHVDLQISDIHCTTRRKRVRTEEEWMEKEGRL